ncbi:MAG: serine protease [Balneolaceae bacterium]
MKQYIFSLFCLVISATLLSGCSGSEKTARIVHETETRYMSSTGSDFMRDEIKKGMESVKRLHNSVSYRTYQFDLDNLPTQQELINTDFDSRAVQTTVDHHSKAGSALILSNRRGRTALLTASHIVTFPDTIWHFAEERGFVQEKVEAVSVRQSVSRVLIGSDDVFGFEMVVNDPDRDLAVLSRNWKPNERPRLTTLRLPTGNSDALDWTDRIYALGYPLGIEMVTSAMISKSGQTGRRGMVLDASFNRGFSGGSLFAVRGDGSAMEWVGIISSASGETVDYLVPDQLRDENFRPNLEYTGAIYTQRNQQINYGITFAVSVDQIKDFYSENRDELRRLGITIRALE